MINEYFLERGIEICVSFPDNHPLKSYVFQSIYYILKWYRNENDGRDTDISLKGKFELLLYFSQFRFKYGDFNLNQFKDKLYNGKFQDYISYLEQKKKEYSNSDLDRIVELISNKKKIFNLLEGKSNIEKLFTDFDSGNYDDDREIIGRWENQISSLHSNYIDIKKIENSLKLESLDFLRDDYDNVVKSLVKNREEAVPTGYTFLDETLTNGGFQKSRLYLIGGTSGLGKSILLLNFISNAAKIKNYNESDDPKDWKTYLYITAENLINESWERLYCCTFDIPSHKLKENLSNNQNFSTESKQKFISLLKENKTNIISKYIEPKRTTVSDIDSIVGMSMETSDIQAVYIDYIDLLSGSLSKNTDKRFELDEISKGLKNISRAYNIPVITVTQLNKDGYKETSAKPTQMSESMFKYNNSDVVVFIQKDGEDPVCQITSNGRVYGKKLRMSVIKNRDGESDVVFPMMLPDKLEENKNFCFKIIEMKDLHRDAVASFDKIGPEVFETQDEINFEDNNINNDESHSPENITETPDGDLDDIIVDGSNDINRETGEIISKSVVSYIDDL